VRQSLSPPRRQSVYRSGRCYVHELLDCTRNPPPDRNAGRIPDLSEFVGPSRAFCLGQVAITLQHQVGDAPDVDLGDHAVKSYKSNLYRRLSTRKGKAARSAAFATGRSQQ